MRTPREPRELTEQDAEVLLAGEEPLVVESYYAGWDTPWRSLSAADWGELEREFGERVRCAALETGRNRALATRYELETIPQVLVFLAGALVARFHGRTPVAKVADAVREARRLARARGDAAAELATISAPTLFPLPSVLRRRGAEEPSEREPVLSRAG